MSGGNWKEMFNAGCEGDLPLVRYHVEAGVDVNYAHPEYLSTPLVAAILAGQTEVALYLLEQGADPELPSEFDEGQRPIEAALRMELEPVVQRLRELGVAPPRAPRPAAARPQAWWRRLLLLGELRVAEARRRER